MIDLSIIIVNWNTRLLLKNCLNSIFLNTKKIKFEIFVVDNNSTDGTQDMIASEFPEVKLICNNENLGFSRSNNQAILLSSGRNIALINSDIKLCDNVLLKMVKFLDCSPDAGLVGCKLLNQDGSLQYSCRNELNLSAILFMKIYLDILFPGSRIFGHHRMSYWGHNDTRSVGYVPACLLVVRKSVLSEVCGLDERFFMYYEDADLCKRIKKNGWNTYYLHDVVAYHYHSASIAKHPSIIFRLSVSDKSMIKYFIKHRGLWTVPILVSFILLNLMISAIVFVFKRGMLKKLWKFKSY